MILFILLILYLVPVSIVAAGTWLVWRLARPRLSPGGAALVAALPVLLIVLSEMVPAELARRIARNSAVDVANSVLADSILFGTAQGASEAIADQSPGLCFAEGALDERQGRSYQHIPRGMIRFSKVRVLAPGEACRSDEAEEWLGSASGGPAIRKCVGWQPVGAPAARFERFHNRFVRYRIGPYRITEQQHGLLRRADQKPFNIDKTIEVSGGLWWHLQGLWFDLAGLDGAGPRGHVSGTFEFIPRGEYVDFSYRGALAGSGRAP